MINSQAMLNLLILFLLLFPSDLLASSQKYLFYLHGGLLEMKGYPASHPVHGPYEYQKIITALEQQGFIVKTEIRRQQPPLDYAKRLSQEVNALLKEGVAPENITVAGHSKGGIIAVIASSLLQQPKIKYVILAGCGQGAFKADYEHLLRQFGNQLMGQFLSIYDASDKTAGTCNRLFAKPTPSLSKKEVVLDTGLGHGLFYQPNQKWIELVTSF